MATATTLKDIKDRLDHAGSKADFDALSAELAKAIHAEEILHNPRLGAKEQRERNKREAQLKVERLRTLVLSIKENKKPGGKYAEVDQLEYRAGLERAEGNLERAEDELARLS